MKAKRESEQSMSHRSWERLPIKDPETDAYCAIVETLQGSRNKMKYDPERGLFTLHSVLPMGTSFPYDFGFLPSTLGEDGDPFRGRDFTLQGASQNFLSVSDCPRFVAMAPVRSGPAGGDAG
jgi:inorganic pyrophosphatase